MWCETGAKPVRNRCETGARLRGGVETAEGVFDTHIAVVVTLGRHQCCFACLYFDFGGRKATVAMWCETGAKPVRNRCETGARLRGGVETAEGVFDTHMAVIVTLGRHQCFGHRQRVLRTPSAL